MNESRKVDHFVDQEIDKSIQKIKELFSYGIHQSSCVFVPDQKVSSVSFQTSSDVHEKAKETEDIFHKELEEIMEQRQLPQHLYKILLEQKHATTLILEQYDRIITELSESLTEYDKEYRQKCEKHSFQHQLLEENIEDLISEINRIGKEEIQNIRMSIVKNTKNKIDRYWEECKTMLDESSADIPFDDYMWKPPTTMLPLEELVDAFVIPHDEVVAKRRDMFSKICDLRKDLERKKLDCALKLEVLEKELFDVKENYKKKKLSFAKLKRKQTQLIAKRDALCRGLREVQRELEKECRMQKKILAKHRENKKVKSYLLQEDNLKYNCIFKERSMDAYQLVTDIIHAFNGVTEDILGIQGYPDWSSFQVNYKNLLPFLFKKGYWYDFLHAAPNMTIIQDVLKAVEDYWLQLKLSSDLLEEKSSLTQQNRDLQNFLKNYHSFL